MTYVLRVVFGLVTLLLTAACANNADGAAQENATSEEAVETSGPDIGETGGMCGGIAGFQCKSETEYCYMEPGQCLKVADAAGVCKEKAQACTREYKPVCGCDGETYSNACMAAVAGVSVAHPRECQPKGY